ncbi:MAG: transglycosylase SLT domain-containing protein [Patescibacteria group bacterium]|jgi:soluble lytic murein transglycosylase-like protein|nr:transglycosylase SLT domain-containing protein [Patescibacteria group bacterium]
MRNIFLIPLILIFLLIPNGETTKEYPREDNSPYIEVRTAYQNISEQNLVLSSKVSYNGYLGLLKRYDNWNADLMYEIMKCESNFNRKAVGDTETMYSSYGLLQIRNLPSRNYKVETLFNPEENIRIANEIFGSQGYGAWLNCYKSVR